jgi:hypothetical protein
MSRSKEALYRESGEADYDEAGSPRPGESDQDESTSPPVVRPEHALRPERR